MASDTLTTKVSTKGQVILPKAIRDQRRWGPGTMLEVELTDQGVLLKVVPAFPPTRSEDVFGMLRYEGPPKTIEDMNAAILREAKRRHARDRY